MSSIDGLNEQEQSFADKSVHDDGSDDDDLPIILEYIPSTSLQVNGVRIKTEKIDDDDILDIDMTDSCPKLASYSIDQLLADHQENEKILSMASELRIKVESPVQPELSKGNEDLLPEHKAELEKMNFIEKRIKKLHAGEAIFDSCLYRHLFSYPESLTLTSCGFVPGQSRTDQVLSSLPPDQLLEFLSPELFRIVFPAMSSQEKFLTFIFYLLSISPDLYVSQRLHGILDVVLHGRLSTWTPSTFDVCLVLSNFGASLSNICPERSVLNFSEKDLKCRFVKPGPTGCFVEVNHEEKSDETAASAEGFKRLNLKLIMQFVTDSLATRAEKYSPQDCLVLTLTFLRISLDRTFSLGQLSLDFERFFAAAINAVPPEHWDKWIRDFCCHLSSLTDDHHNMVYLVGLMPLVERGLHLKRVMSLVFMYQLLPSPNTYEDFFEPKVRHCLNFLRMLPTDKGSDFYRMWSVIHLLENSVGPEPPEAEAADLSLMIDFLQQKSSQIRDSIYQVDQIVVKDQLVWLVSKLKLLVKEMGQKELFDSVVTPVVVERISNLPEDGSDNETNMDTMDSESD